MGYRLYGWQYNKTIIFHHSTINAIKGRTKRIMRLWGKCDLFLFNASNIKIVCGSCVTWWIMLPSPVRRHSILNSQRSLCMYLLFLRSINRIKPLGEHLSSFHIDASIYKLRFRSLVSGLSISSASHDGPKWIVNTNHFILSKLFDEKFYGNSIIIWVINIVNIALHLYDTQRARNVRQTGQNNTNNNKICNA